MAKHSSVLQGENKAFNEISDQMRMFFSDSFENGDIKWNLLQKKEAESRPKPYQLKMPILH